MVEHDPRFFPSPSVADVGSDVSAEELREALNSLARARDQADRRARENALIIEVLSILLRPQSPARLIARVLSRLRRVLPFETAMLLETCKDDPTVMEAVFAVPQHAAGGLVPIGPMLSRALAGRVVNIVDAGQVPDLVLSGLAESLRGGVLALPITAPSMSGVLLLGKGERGGFSKEDGALGERLSVLGSQVQVSLEAREMRSQAASLAEEKIAAEKARADSERREVGIRTLLDGLPIGIYLKNPNGQYRIVNQAMESLLGRAPGSTVGQTPGQIFSPAVGELLMADTALVFARGERATREVTINQDGETRRIRIMKAPVDLDGTQVIAGTMLDVTEQRAAEEALVAAKRSAEGANAAKTAFLATMSHEIRTPLNGVIGLIGVLNDTSLGQEQGRLVKAAQDSAEHLLAIVNDILDMSKLEAGKIELEDEPIDLTPAISQVVDLMRPAAREQGNRLILETEIPVGMMVRGDLGRLRQVLFNLIGNAVKFTRDGMIKVALGSSEGASVQGTSAPLLQITISDTGVGIAPDKLVTIFDRFSQADSSINRIFGGTGLGLAICKEICTLMGGDISVESEEGKGSVFQVTLPLREIPAGVVRLSGDSPGAAPQELIPHRALHVLVVDDVPVNCDVLSHLLRRDGHRVEVALSGREAVDRTRAVPFDAILMDVQMPDMDGIAATRAIRRLEAPQASVPIIAVTASAMPGDRESFIAAGMDHYLSKPVRREALRRTLVEITGVTSAVPVGEDLSPEEGARQAETSPEAHDESVDWALIDETVAFVGAESFAMAWGLLRKDLVDRVSRLAEEVGAEELANLRPYFHAIKGSAATYGLTGASNLAAQGELATDRQTAAIAIARLQADLPDAIAAVDAHLKREA